MSTLHSHTPSESYQTPLFDRIQNTKDLNELLLYAGEWLKKHPNNSHPEHEQLEQILQKECGFDTITFNYPIQRDTSYLQRRDEIDIEEIAPEVTNLIRGLQMSSNKAPETTEQTIKRLIKTLAKK